MTVRYATTEVDLLKLAAPWFGEQAEVIKGLSLDEDGRTLRVIVKATEEVLPDGATSWVEQLPHCAVELITQPVLCKFTRQT